MSSGTYYHLLTRRQRTITDDWVGQRLRQCDYWVVRIEHPLYADNVVFLLASPTRLMPSSAFYHAPNRH